MAAAALTARFRGLPRPFYALFGGTLVNRLGGVVEPFLALYLAHRDLPVAQIGLIVALSGFGSLLGQLAGGVIADRIGRRQAFLTGMTGAAASFALLGAADATWLLVVGGFLAGGFTDFYRPASSALVHDLVGAGDRPRAYGLLFWAINLGFAAGATLAGALAERGFGLLFALDAATCLACAIIWRFVPPGTEPPRAGDEPGRLRDVLADRLMVVFCLVVALQATVSLGMGIEGLTPILIAYVLPVVIWTAGEILVTSVAPATVADLAPAHLRARYQAVFGTAFSGAFIVAPPPARRLFDAAGGRALWGACGAVGIAAALGQLALGPAIARRTEGQ